VKVEGLRQVLIKSGAQAELHFFALSMGGERDRFFPGLPFFRFHHQVKTASVGQTDVAHERFKTQVVEQAQRVLHGCGRHDLVAAMTEETGKNFAAIRVIFD